MSEEEQKQETLKVLATIAHACKLEGIDFFMLDNKQKNMIMLGFQVGIAYWHDKLKEDVLGYSPEEVDF